MLPLTLVTQSYERSMAQEAKTSVIITGNETEA